MQGKVSLHRLPILCAPFLYVKALLLFPWTLSSSFLLDISLGHLSETPYSILPLPGILLQQPAMNETILETRTTPKAVEPAARASSSDCLETGCRHTQSAGGHPVLPGADFQVHLKALGFPSPIVLGLPRGKTHTGKPGLRLNQQVSESCRGSHCEGPVELKLTTWVNLQALFTQLLWGFQG